MASVTAPPPPARSPTSASRPRPRRASWPGTGSAVKDAALHAIADALVERTPEILEANARDLEAGRESGLSDALMDRLALDAGRVAAIAAGRARRSPRCPTPSAR